jgi:hypothetical protein
LRLWSALPIEGDVDTYLALCGRLLDARLRRFTSLLRGRLDGVEIREANSKSAVTRRQLRRSIGRSTGSST